MKYFLKFMFILLITGCVNSSDNKIEQNKSSGERAKSIEGTFKSNDTFQETVIFSKIESNSYMAEFTDGVRVVGMLHEHVLDLPQGTKFVFSEDYNEAEHFRLNGSRMFYRIGKK